ncbi:MAG: 5-formyltetrahydrofolate cyclo-ligase, partial [Bacteroidales bacterium]|nr:5-formyltetrahydrofolate cyclo-ligase [Bacteroidales bacterium]
MQIIEQKKSIRKEIRQKKLLYGSNELDFISSIICRKVMQLEQIKSSQTILIYNSLPDEVQTSLLFTLKEAGKRIVLPVVTGDILILKEYIPGKLSVGYMNILEPNQEETVDPNEIDLAIIPGVAFDKECNRPGRGKGYYDKLLPCTNCPKIGICY